MTEEHDQDCLAVLWRAKLAGMPSTFGRLLYFSSVRDCNTGRYFEPILAEQFGKDVSDHALRYCHNVSFAEWLSYTLEQQTADLHLYLSALRDNKQTVLRTWLQRVPRSPLKAGSGGF